MITYVSPDFFVASLLHILVKCHVHQSPAESGPNRLSSSAEKVHAVANEMLDCEHVWSGRHLSQININEILERYSRKLERN